jgi:hypothetical protein
MKIQLREHVRFDGIQTRAVDVARIDWDKRACFLADGRWVPFENVTIGDPPPGVDLSDQNLAEYMDAVMSGRAARPDVWACACGKQLPSARALGGHKRHCKGPVQ